MKREKMTEGEKIMCSHGRFKVNKAEDLTLWDKRTAARIDRLLARERNKAAWDGWRDGSFRGLTEEESASVVEQKYGPRPRSKR